MSTLAAACIAFVVGAGAAGAFLWLLRRREGDLAARLASEAQQAKAEEMAALVQQLQTAFSSLSRQALSANAGDFLQLAKPLFDQQITLGDQTLESKKKLIDARLEAMNGTLNTLNSLIQNVEKQRAESQGALQRHLETNADATRRLQLTTAQLREALANPQRRGQWGERMAEDVLRLAGFVEGVNYHKQQILADGGKPDFTFLLPGDRRVHMDVKFPLVNYLKVLDAPDDAGRAQATDQFLKDVRKRIKEVTGREYIDPAAGTVDYVLVFIPNEQVYGFIHEHDAVLLDDALRSKVVLCSPLTLYAILAVVRQAVENFRFEQGSKKILDHLGEFQKQWGKFVETMERMGRKLDEARNEYDELKTTRTRLLERQLDKIEDLRAAREEPVAGLGDATRT
ncbi:MAG: DNA recombination protein RmuC [Planctomycetota bacterium]